MLKVTAVGRAAPKVPTGTTNELLDDLEEVSVTVGDGSEATGVHKYAA